LSFGIDESASILKLSLPRFPPRTRFPPQLLYDCIQAPGADILGLLVDRPGDLGETPDPVRQERYFHFLRRKQGLVLAG